MPEERKRKEAGGSKERREMTEGRKMAEERKEGR
jgi:hypothetical protein